MDSAQLFDFLETYSLKYNRPEFIENDPIQIPHQFTQKEDIEIAGFLAASIAWGQRPVIIRNANSLLERMDYAPADFVRNSTEKDLEVFNSFKHRFNCSWLFRFRSFTHGFNQRLLHFSHCNFSR